MTLPNYSVFAQGFECSIEESNTSPLLNIDALSCPISSSPVDELLDLEVNVNIHFIAHQDPNYSGNFYPSASDDWSILNGNKYAELFLNYANSKLSDLKESPTSLANFLGSAKYQFKLYSDPNNTDDLHNGIWYWESLSDFYSNMQYGDKVLHIIFKDKHSLGFPVFSGSASGLNFQNKVTLEGAYNNAVSQLHLENFEPQLINWQPMNNDVNHGSFSVIQNPDNSYSTVGKYVKGILGNSTLEGDFPFYNLSALFNYPILTMKVKAPTGASEVKMILHSQSLGEKSVVSSISSTGEWVNIDFDFSAHNAITDFESISLVFDPNVIASGAEYLFDELKYKDKSYFGFWSYGNILNHEAGHTFGLCHSFSSQETCSDVDVIAESNCTNGGVGTTSCGYLPGPGCNPWDSGSGNIMGYNAPINALTPCQWDKVYTGLIEHWPNHLNCDPEPEPIIIPTGSDVVWDYLKLINQDVIVEPGAKLTITCEVRMGHDRHILVERGAQLIVDGGKLTSLCRHFWHGVVVAGNREKEQPNAPYYNQELDDAGIVIVKNHSVIKHASVGIQASGEFHSPWSENAARWGGLIVAEHSTFVNNKKAVAFYSYDYQNKSSFKFCEFKENSEFYDGTVGVTVWDCDGITFERNSFENFDLSGILGINYSAKVKDANVFSNNTRGIESFATHPFASYLEVGDATTTPNIFEDNVEAHIFANGNDGPNGLKVIRNEFYNGQYGVWVDGASVYDIKENWFNNQQNRSVNLFRTGNNANYVSCNSYYGMPVGLAVLGKNGRTQFLGNTFAPPISLNAVDVAIANVGTEKGQVREFIGAWVTTAGNCFSSAVDISAKQNETVPFYYFYDDTPPTGTCHYLPVDNLSDGGVNNYSFIQAFSTSSSPCDKDEKGGIFTLDELMTKRAILAIKKAQFDANPENVQMGLDYYDAFQEKDEVLISLVKQAIDSRNYQEADGLLAGENTVRAEQWRFGLALETGDFETAKSLLDALETSNDIEQDFVEIQTINIERLENPDFILTQGQNTFLHEVATNSSTSRGYAQAILALLTEERFELSAPLTMEGSNAPVDPPLNEEKELRAEPNPTSGWTTFTWDEIGFTSLQVSDVFSGTIVTNQAIDPQSTSIQLDLTTLSGTFYSIRIEGEGKTPIYGRMIKANE